MTDYEEMVPLGTYLVRCLSAKPGVHFADKKMAADMIARSVACRIEKGKLDRDKALLAAQSANAEEEKEKARLAVGRRTVSDPEAELRKVMKGHWQKGVPSKDGQYWTATRDGHIAGLMVVAYLEGKLMLPLPWEGWWWSEPVEKPPKPPAWDGEE